jgi:hypothetical protein
MEDKKKSGYDILTEMSHLIIEMDSVDTDDEDAINDWFDKMNGVLAQAGDKVLAYRNVLSLAKKRQVFFAEERDRYAKRFRAQGRVLERVKELSHLLVERNYKVTGQKKLLLEDGTWATLATRKAFRFFNSETGETELDARELPDVFVKMEVSKSALKAAAKRGEEIPGVDYEQVEKTHVRFS